MDILATARERIGRGTYLKTDPTWESWERARVVNLARTIAALECGTDVRACLTSAAVLWDLPIWQFPTTVDILIGRKGWRKSVDLMGSSRASGRLGPVAAGGSALFGSDRCC